MVNSFSKYFGMTGWRLGWAVGPTAFAPVLDRIAQNLYLAAPTLAQYAALAAFGAETLQLLDDRRNEFRRRRDYLVRALRGLGVIIPVRPGGAFYIYGDCSPLAGDVEALARDILETAGVATTPGIDFGVTSGRDYLRFAFTTHLDRLEEGVTRMGAVIERRGRGSKTPVAEPLRQRAPHRDD